MAEYSTILNETRHAAYLTADHLGSPRVNTNENGAVIARHDYRPYGEEIIGLGGRSTTDKYVADDVRQGFTGYLNDEETGLDYAQARYYATYLGRFHSSDPISISRRRVTNPQVLNMYAYCGNNPLKYVDPDGKEIVPLGQHTNSEIDNRLAEIELELTHEDPDATDKESRSRRSELEAEARTLRAEKEGNATVGAWLDALNESGQNNSMKLSDFVLTTDPANDLAKAARDSGESRVAIDDIVKQGSGTELVGTVIKRQIYILQTSDVYQATLRGGVTGTAVGDISRDYVARLGGSYLSMKTIIRETDGANTMPILIRNECWTI